MTDAKIEIKFELAGADPERLVVVGSDLEYLHNLPRDRLATHTEVRLAASVLRRLLVDGHLATLWARIGAAGLTPLVLKATDLDSALRAWPMKWLWYAWAGGGISGAANHAGFILARVPAEDQAQYPTPEALLKQNPPPQVLTQQMSLTSWLKSTSFALRTDQGVVPVSRSQCSTT
ncbi:MAG: hypothetical protein WCQ48_08470 [Chloroflexota bacterium]